MKIRKPLAAVALALVVAAGGVTAATSIAHASSSSDSPEIGVEGETVDGPPGPGVSVVKGELGIPTQ